MIGTPTLDSVTNAIIWLRFANNGYPAVLTAAEISSSVSDASTLHLPLRLISILSGRGGKT